MLQYIDCHMFTFLSLLVHLAAPLIFSPLWKYCCPFLEIFVKKRIMYIRRRDLYAITKKFSRFDLRMLCTINVEFLRILSDSQAG